MFRFNSLQRRVVGSLLAAALCLQLTGSATDAQADDAKSVGGQAATLKEKVLAAWKARDAKTLRVHAFWDQKLTVWESEKPQIRLRGRRRPPQAGGGNGIVVTNTKDSSFALDGNRFALRWAADSESRHSAYVSNGSISSRLTEYPGSVNGDARIYSSRCFDGFLILEYWPVALFYKPSFLLEFQMPFSSLDDAISASESHFLHNGRELPVIDFTVRDHEHSIAVDPEIDYAPVVVHRWMEMADGTLDREHPRQKLVIEYEPDGAEGQQPKAWIKSSYRRQDVEALRAESTVTRIDLNGTISEGEFDPYGFRVGTMIQNQGDPEDKEQIKTENGLVPYQPKPSSNPGTMSQQPTDPGPPATGLQTTLFLVAINALALLALGIYWRVRTSRQ